MVTKPKPAAKKSAKKPAKKPTRKARKKPTLKQEKFVNEYLANGGNGVQAARAAGYKGDTNTLNQVARDNLQKPTIASRVRERVDGLAATSAEVLNVLGDHLRADLADFRDCFNSDGELDLDAAKRAGVSHLAKKVRSNTRIITHADGTTERVVQVELELHDAQGAAKVLADLHGLKQAPRANEADRERKAQLYERMIERIIERAMAERGEAVSRADVINRIATYQPEIREYIN